ncbi:MAG: hypothetical protein EB075_15600, partial [Bacteroidetes bacterium]|nr:hypothetical protein [Bacteroidota bacterium]
MFSGSVSQEQENGEIAMATVYLSAAGDGSYTITAEVVITPGEEVALSPAPQSGGTIAISGGLTLTIDAVNSSTNVTFVDDADYQSWFASDGEFAYNYSGTYSAPAGGGSPSLVTKRFAHQNAGNTHEDLVANSGVVSGPMTVGEIQINSGSDGKIKNVTGGTDIGEVVVWQQLSTETVARAAVSDALASETSSREAGDAGLTASIADESSSRVWAINNEASIRAAADANLSSIIDLETSERVVLGGRV